MLGHIHPDRPTRFCRQLSLYSRTRNLIYGVFKKSMLLEHLGMCDASAAIAIDTTKFIAASDEDNYLRIYKNQESGPPLQEINIEPFLIPDSDNREADIEGAAHIEDIVFWITSHGRNKKGKRKDRRYELFAVKINRSDSFQTDSIVTGFGQPYTRLQEDMLKDLRLKRYNLEESEKLPPKEKNGFNIEGLCATPERHLLIGFRNPIPDGQALIVPLINPLEVIQGQTAELGDPVELNLDGLGIRSLEYWQERDIYLIVAGAFDSSNTFKLFRWSGSHSEPPHLMDGIDFSDLRIEGLISYPGESSKFQVLSDDGTRCLKGKECKELEDPSDRRFRSLWVDYSA